jgi:hypothetical protein
VRVVVVATAVGCGFLIASGAHGARSATSPCPGVPYVAPPLDAPPAPEVKCVAGLLGIGNIGIPRSSIPKNGPQPVGAPVIPFTAPRKLSSANRAMYSTSCSGPHDPNFGLLWAPVSAGNPSSVSNSNTQVGGLSVSMPGSAEHVAGGLITWQTPTGNWWVQMGYLRGNTPTWTDNLGPGYSAAYLEFETTGGTYNFTALLAVPDYNRHTFTMTSDSSGHYFNFYLDGALKWANVYDADTPSIVAVGNEDYTLDSTCESGYSDNNGFSLPLGAAQRIILDAGHAVGTAGETGPWTSDGDTFTAEALSLGYSCNVLNPNGYYWWCG